MDGQWRLRNQGFAKKVTTRNQAKLQGAQGHSKLEFFDPVMSEKVSPSSEHLLQPSNKIDKSHLFKPQIGRSCFDSYGFPLRSRIPCIQLRFLFATHLMLKTNKKRWHIPTKQRGDLATRGDKLVVWRDHDLRLPRSVCSKVLKQHLKLWNQKWLLCN